MNKITHKKDFLTELSNVMEDKVFSTFFDEYFTNWDDIVASIMLMKAYQALSKKYSDLEPNEITSTLRNLMKNGDFRHNLAIHMNAFMNQTHMTDSLLLPDH